MRRFAFAASLLVALTLAQPAGAPAQTGVFTVDGNIALSSLMALGDGHLRKLADTLQLVAHTDAARSHDWKRIRPLLAHLAPMNVPCLLWFARPDGSYWTLQTGRASGNLATRDYFPQLLRGRTVLGDLVVSKATKKATAIVAVPVVDRGAVVGALGASVYLDKLSALVREEMRLPANAIFFSFDSRARVALNWDNTLIFLEPRTLSPDLDRAFGAMLAHTQGVERYTFRNAKRTVIYRKSPVTKWWYAIGFAEK